MTCLTWHDMTCHDMTCHVMTCLTWHVHDMFMTWTCPCNMFTTWTCPCNMFMNMIILHGHVTQPCKIYTKRKKFKKISKKISPPGTTHVMTYHDMSRHVLWCMSWHVPCQTCHVWHESNMSCLTWHVWTCHVKHDMSPSLPSTHTISNAMKLQVTIYKFKAVTWRGMKLKVYPGKGVFYFLFYSITLLRLLPNPHSH